MSILIGQNLQPVYNMRLPAIVYGRQTNAGFNLAAQIEGKYGVLMFYTLDFSYVCATEMLAIKNRIKHFEALNAEVVVVSGDSHMSHMAWQETPPEKGGVGKLPFIMASDISRTIAKEYGILVNESIPLPATYIIDPEGYFRYQAIHDMPIGRNIDEILRVLSGLHAHQETGHLVPANWKPKQEMLQADKAHLASYLQKNAASI